MYARYAIESDYLNLISEACLRFYYLASYLKQKEILFPFLLNLEFFATPFMGQSRLGTQLVVVVLFGMRPHAIRDLETILRVMLMLDQDFATMLSYALYVELNLVPPRAGQFPSRAEPCGDMQFLCGRFHKIVIMQYVP